MGHLNVVSHERVFRAIVHTMDRERLRVSGWLSYSRLMDLLLETISRLGMHGSSAVWYA